MDKLTLSLPKNAYNLCEYQLCLEEREVHQLLKTIYQKQTDEVLIAIGTNAGLKPKGIFYIKGTIKEVPIYHRDIIRFLLCINATHLYITHNHIGTLKFSDSDVYGTHCLNEFLIISDLGITLQDHILFSQGKVISMHEDKEILDFVWGEKEQSPLEKFALSLEGKK